MAFEATTAGVYVTFESYPGFELALATLDPQRGADRPELVAVSSRVVDNAPIERATVFVPDGGMGYFVARFEEYATENTPKGNPRYQDFVERVASIRLATIELLWTDAPEDFPAPDELIWWEVWMRRRDGAEVARLLNYAAGVGATVLPRRLLFDRRVITVVHATPVQLSRSIDVLDDLAELRHAKAPVEFFMSLPGTEQAEWAADLLNRTTFADDDSPAVCLLDTGVTRGHPLLEGAIAEADVHTCNPVWGTHDHGGHGTGMAGVALFGQLADVLSSDGPINLHHGLESVKVIGPANDTDPDLYGAVTAEAVSRVEVANSDRSRVFCMAVTAPADRQGGMPTLWSSVVDALAAGRLFDQLNGELRYIDDADPGAMRLFLISAGNVDPIDPVANYLDICDTAPVEDPGQAWNALTVGAFTDLIDIAADPDWAGYTSIAPSGDLSPSSRTSVSFARSWATKPDFVCEGGNAATNGQGVAFPDSLQLLTTNFQPVIRLFRTFGMTSAATAEAARLACHVQSEYPSFWPETIRALLVHAAEWTPQMRNQFTGVGQAKQAREGILRRYGYGVPTAERALRSAADSVTLVMQDVIRPFAKGRLREMHLHSLPWPEAVLHDLGEQPVRLRVTLSYFIEPVATRRGWRRRFRYPSHGLRFEIKKPLESVDEFRKRINKLALDEDEGKPASGDAVGWFLGVRARNRGSLHADFWEGTAAELAERGSIAIYPVHGWWKEQPARDRSELGARYALVVSIETAAAEVDLWTPIANQIGVPIEIAPEW